MDAFICFMHGHNWRGETGGIIDVEFPHDTCVYFLVFCTRCGKTKFKRREPRAEGKS